MVNKNLAPRTSEYRSPNSLITIRHFNTIARSYHFLECLCFGNTLQRARVSGIPYLADSQRALLIGDGDGRFAAALLGTNPTIHLTSLDSSSRMIELAQARTRKHSHRIQFECTDALSHSYPPSHYDALCLHFILDCFPQPQAEQLQAKLLATLKPNSPILYSDFQANNLIQRFTIRSLYLAFRLTTRLKTRRLPHIDWQSHAELIFQSQYAKGLLFSEAWKTTG